MHKNRFALVAWLMTAVLVFTACAAPAAPSGEMAADGDMEMAGEATGPVTLDWNLGTEPPSLDPSLATDTASLDVLRESFLGLTELDPDTQEAVAELATDWSASENDTVWTFNMRDDVQWVQYMDGEVMGVTDEAGEPRMVTANDIVYGVRRVCNPATASDYSYVLYVIAGCQDVNQSEEEVTDADLEAIGVAALDDYTVEFTLNYGASFFPQIASMWVTWPLPQEAIEAGGDQWTEPGNIYTNGPYTISEWIHNDSLQLVRNPMWYGWDEMADAGNIEVINMDMIEESSTEFAQFQTGAYDFSAVPLEEMDAVLDGTSPVSDLYINTAQNCTYYYGFVTEKEAVSDVNVRRALSMAVDRATLVDRILKGGQIPANTFTNPLNYGSPAEDTDVAPWALTEEQGGTGYAAAVEMAQELMAEAGYADGEGLDLTLAHNVSEGHARIAQAIQAMWKEAFPQMSVNIETQEWGVYLSSLQNDAPLEGKPDVYRLAWCADYPHANNWIHEVFNPTQGENEPLLKMDDPVIGDAVTQFNDATIAAQTASPEEQIELYKTAESLFVDDIAAIIPIYYYTTNLVVQPYLDRIYSSDKYMYRWTIDQAAKESM